MNIKVSPVGLSPEDFHKGITKTLRELGYDTLNEREFTKGGIALEVEEHGVGYFVILHLMCKDENNGISEEAKQIHEKFGSIGNYRINV